MVPPADNAIGTTPYTAIQTQNFRTPSYSETDLTGGGLNGTDSLSELGGRFDEYSARPTWSGRMTG